MLILAKQYVEEHGGNPDYISLFGQDENGNAWTICRLNMILHNIKNSDIEQGDTLLNPAHLDEDNELRRFQYILSNPPFSQDYKKDEMQFQERFSLFCPETGKKADLMLLPSPIIDYVVIHELVHLHESHHQPSFWELVAQAMPDYASRKRWLAENGSGL